MNPQKLIHLKLNIHNKRHPDVQNHAEGMVWLVFSLGTLPIWGCKDLHMTERLSLSLLPI